MADGGHLEFLKSHGGEVWGLFCFEFRTYSGTFPESFIFLDFFSISYLKKSNALRLKVSVKFEKS